MSSITDDNLHLLELRYSLSKRIPDMRRGFIIETSCGVINIDAEDAAPFERAVRELLTRKILELDHD